MRYIDFRCYNYGYYQPILKNIKIIPENGVIF